jgi:hypothetical protein
MRAQNSRFGRGFPLAFRWLSGGFCGVFPVGFSGFSGFSGAPDRQVHLTKLPGNPILLDGA